MCGILAYFNSEGISGEQLGNLTTSLKKIKHRGPDGEGITLINTKKGTFYNLITDETPAANLQNKVSFDEASKLDFDLFFGHRRLSIIDVSVNGHQPMYFENGNWIIYNGEIFNYIELRDELKKLNYSFKTDSDTEVILAAYDKWGNDCFAKLNGMWSIVIYDAKKKQLISCNDRYGVKPLYYHKTNKEITFVSELIELKPLHLKLSYNEDTISSFLKNVCIDNEETFYNEVKRHLTANYAVVDLSGQGLTFNSHPYYKIDTKELSYKENEISERFKELFESAVKLRLRSDVPLGFAISGGLDSSAVLYTSLKHLKGASEGTKPVTFSAVFPGMEGDESYFINLIEKDLGIKSFYCNPLEEFSFEEFEQIIYHQNFPINSTSYCAEWSVSKLIQEKNIKVALVGQGGDELLAGYHYHFFRYCRELILKGKISEYLGLAKKYTELKGLNINYIHRQVLNEVKLAAKFKLGLVKYGRSAVNKWDKANTLVELLRLDLTENIMPTLLRADDRNSMAFSVETRQPFLDYRLVDFCFSIPSRYKIKDGWQKAILRDSVKEMPHEIQYRKDKKGFTTPHKLWIDKYKTNFEEYLKYIPEHYLSNSESDTFKKYSLGAWFKLEGKK